MQIAFIVCLFLCALFNIKNAAAQRIDTVGNYAADFLPQATTALKHNYPLPATVMGYKSQLGLSAAQLKSLAQITATLKLKQRETNMSATHNEQVLDSLFKTGRLNEGVIIFYTNRYGLYEGEYRGAVLMACYLTRKLLTPRQFNKLLSLQNHN